MRLTPANWDAVQFALAVDTFDLHAHQPHPPGYILYVLAGRVFNLLVNEPSLALSLLSVLASGIALPLFYGLVRRIFEDGTVAWGATLMLATSPLAFYYGSVGLTYMPEMLLSVMVAVLCWRVKSAAEQSPRLAVLLALALGMAGGVRQTSLLVMLPMCIWALWGHARRSWVVFVLTLVGVCLLWFVPLLALSGGLSAYLHENSLLAGAVMSRTSVFDAGMAGLAYNVAFEVLALVCGLGLGLVPLGLWAVRLVRFNLAGKVRVFLSLWIVPALAFYSVSHVGQYGYLLVVLPPLVVLSAVAARALGMNVAMHHARLAVRASGDHLGLAACGVVILFSLGYFLLAQGPVTASAIESNDTHWRTLREGLSSHDPASTALVMSIAWSGPFRQAGYLLPRYHSYGLDLNEDDRLRWLYSAEKGTSDYALPVPEGRERLDLPPGTRTIVALDPTTAARFAPEGVLDCVALADGSALYVLELPGSQGTPQLVRALVIEGETITPVLAPSTP